MSGLCSDPPPVEGSLNPVALDSGLSTPHYYRMTTYEDTLTLACPPEQAFEFLIRPANIIAISPPEMGLRLVEAPERLQLSGRMEFEAHAYGMKQKILHEIIEFEHPHRFVEQQVQGPFKFYRHEHVIRAHDGQNVQLIDRVEFQPPGGLAGMLLTESRILKGLQHAFEHRHRELKKHLEAPR